MKKAIVIEKENGKRIVFVRQSDTMVLVLKIIAALNMALCVFMTFNKEWLLAFLDFSVSFIPYAMSKYIERNNEIYDFFENYNDN
jgi:uncharacterized membrane protein YjjP (DUF1212 family)